MGRVTCFLAVVTTFIMWASLIHFLPLDRTSSPDASMVTYLRHASDALHNSLFPLKEVDNSSEISTAPLFTTRVPMYYINLDRSPARRYMMEMSFGKSGKLTRIPAIDAREELPESIGDFSSLNLTWADYRNKVRAGPGEIALVLSHVKAMQKALDDGAQYALILEDDASPHLIPFWGLNLDELVDWLEMNYPEWELIRLQYLFANLNHEVKVQKRWRENPELVLSDKSYRAYGTVANLFHARAMKFFTDSLRAADGNFDCSRLKAPCIADYFLVDELKQVRHKTPPMFSYKVFEGKTGVRKGGAAGSVNDAWRVHQEALAKDLKWAVEDYEWRMMRKVAETVVDAEAFSSTNLTQFPQSVWMVKEADK